MKKRERLARLIATLALKGRTSAERLAQIVDEPLTTVYSDVRTLRRAGIPVHGEPGRGGGFLLKPDHTDADLKLAPRDGILLTLAAGVLLSRVPTPADATAMRMSLQNALASLPKGLSDLCGAMWDLRFASPDTQDVSLYADLPELLTNAVQAKLPLIITPASGGRLHLTPDTLQWSAKGWKLIGRDVKSGKRTEIDLAEITAARLDR